MGKSGARILSSTLALFASTLGAAGCSGSNSGTDRDTGSTLSGDASTPSEAAADAGADAATTYDFRAIEQVLFGGGFGLSSDALLVRYRGQVVFERYANGLDGARRRRCSDVCSAEALRTGRDHDGGAREGPIRDRS